MVVKMSVRTSVIAVGKNYLYRWHWEIRIRQDARAMEQNLAIALGLGPSGSSWGWVLQRGYKYISTDCIQSQCSKVTEIFVNRMIAIHVIIPFGTRIAWHQLSLITRFQLGICVQLGIDLLISIFMGLCREQLTGVNPIPYKGRSNEELTDPWLKIRACITSIWVSDSVRFKDEQILQLR